MDGAPVQQGYEARKIIWLMDIDGWYNPSGNGWGLYFILLFCLSLVHISRLHQLLQSMPEWEIQPGTSWCSLLQRTVSVLDTTISPYTNMYTYYIHASILLWVYISRFKHDSAGDTCSTTYAVFNLDVTTWGIKALARLPYFRAKDLIDEVVLGGADHYGDRSIYIYMSLHVRPPNTS